jgi:hypothetical protein
LGRVPNSRRLWSIFLGGGLILGALLHWFFGNFFYDIFWSFLETHNIQHEIIIAKVARHIVPFLLSALLLGMIYIALRYEFMASTRQSVDRGESIKPDMRINDAVDYNDSTAKLKQPGPPRRIEYGQAAGGTMIEVGVQHEDARRLLNNELISGNIRCWGKRQILDLRPIQFETSTREMDRSCWNTLYLHYVHALYYIETEAQTEVLPGRAAEHQWTALMVSQIQVHQIWRRKSLARRLIERAKHRQRIKPHPNW